MLLFRGVFIAALFLAGCGLSESEVYLVSTVTEELRIDLSNTLSADNPLGFKFSTLRAKCESSSLAVEGFNSENSIHVSVAGLTSESSCAMDSSILTNTVPLKVSKGVHQINIAIGDELLNEGSLSFDGETYVMQIADPEGLVIGHNELRKIPVGTLWGNISSRVDLREGFESFTDDLRGATRDAFLPSGYYGHFTIDDASEPALANIEQQSYNYSFVYALTGTRDRLSSILSSFRETYPDAELTCTLWDGSIL